MKNGWRHVAFSVLVAILLFILGAIVVRVWELNDRMTTLETKHNYDERIDILERYSHEHDDR